MELIGKTALVTGGAKRVGREIALAFARRGAHIVLHHNRSEEEAKATASEIKGFGVGCLVLQADLASASEVKKMAAEAERISKKVDILVNSASLYFKTVIDQPSEEEWDKLIDVNLKAPFILATELGRAMKKEGGAIVNIADWSGLRPYKDYAAYCASKGGLITLTRSLARDLAPKVRVNAVAPGPVLPPPVMEQSEIDAIAKTTALGRWGKPEDVASATVFLAENDYINGVVLVVDGGRSIV